MKKEDTGADKKRDVEQYKLIIRRGRLDPFTKLVLLILTAIFCLGGAGGERLYLFRLFLSLLPYLLFLIDGKRKKAAASLGILILCYIWIFMAGRHPVTESGAGRILFFLLLLTANVCTRLLPSLEMGSYAIQTTSVSEFTAAMNRMRMPDTIVIPMSVMFRFFPTIRENMTAIREAMTMRGIKVRNLSKFLEYRLVPLVECTAGIGDDLAASALMRGLGAPGQRTNICSIGFGKGDFLVLLLTAVCFVISLLMP